MSRYTHLAFFLCLMLIASAFMHSARAATIEEQTLIRLDAMEKENAALKQRLKRLERTLPATASGQNQARGQSDPPRGQTGGLDLPDSVTMGAHAQDNGPAQFYKISLSSEHRPLVRSERVAGISSARLRQS